MNEIQKEREAIQRHVSRALGDDYRQPRVLLGHVRVIGLEADILALPVARSSEEFIQIVDPTDSAYGSFRFMAGFSSLDGTDVLI